MSGLFTYSVAGVGFLAIAFLSTLPLPRRLPHLSAALLSSLIILSSLFHSLSASDPIGSPLPLSTAAVASLFLLHSLAFLTNSFPRSLLDLLLLTAFTQEILLISLRRKDLDGIENRYFSLLLAPVTLCTVSTLTSIVYPRHPGPGVARAVGLALHGTWLIQMGFSFFSTAIAHGCAVHYRSGVNYTIKCKGHMEYHRARAIATLQFNCHLALMAVVVVGVYAVVAGRSGGGGGRYTPLNSEMQSMQHSQFTLDSDEEAEEGKGNVGKVNGDVVVPVGETNGFESH